MSNEPRDTRAEVISPFFLFRQAAGLALCPLSSLRRDHRPCEVSDPLQRWVTRNVWLCQNDSLTWSLMGDGQGTDI